jgi:hypothetical protein
MIIRINGEIIQKPLELVDFESFLPKNKQEMKKLKKLATWLWGISGTMLVNSHAFAAGNSQSMWIQMQPLWATFQQIAMVVGGIALFVGILTFVFKRSLGKTIVTTALIVVAGCFLVPSAIMLMGIVGQMMNNVLVDVFSTMGLENSVQVGK